MLIRGTEGKPSHKARIPGIGLVRYYKIRPFADDDGSPQNAETAGTAGTANKNNELSAPDDVPVCGNAGTDVGGGSEGVPAPESAGTVTGTPNVLNAKGVPNVPSVPTKKKGLELSSAADSEAGEDDSFEETF